MIEAIICDLDGLLADTEKLHYGSYRVIFNDLGIELTEDFYKEHWIRDGKGIRDYVNLYHPELELPYLRRRKRLEYIKLVEEEGTQMPGAIDFLKRVKPHYRVTLASSSSSYSVNAVVDKLGIRGFFETFQTKESVENLKPAPDIFLKSAGSVGIAPGECLVLEDAQKGIDAASAAGMGSIAVPTVHTKGNNFSKATMICESLDEVTIELINSL